ncbi:acyl-CoA dehydrogenase family protein [Micromonospora sp. CPCC 206061]|uniref:acyl-CoA dehydrogenase family protein n=1 Tax=Micromonospora sp. CPCC 206061 TaxID=3122410 RepID=UPI002FF08EDF
MPDAAWFLARTDEIVEDVLFPSAAQVDRADRIPEEHLDLLASEGFYGVAAPPEEGGLGPDMTTAAYQLEALASGCLATTFVWMQHHGAVLAAAFSDRPGVQERWLRPLARGERRGGIALTGLRPGAALLKVRPVTGGYLLDGQAPWVTGWGMIDVLYLGARDDADLVHFFLMDAAPADTLSVVRQQLTAAHASSTVTLRFTGHFVPEDRLVATQPHEAWVGDDAAGSALNGFLALGVVRRCCRLLGPGPLDEELPAARAALLAADAATTAVARAAASELALRASAMLSVRRGSRSVLADDPASRSIREAAFLLVFGTRPTIRDALLDRFGASTISSGTG